MTVTPDTSRTAASAQGVSGGRKRIIVCCDGTWQDGIVVNQRWKYTNVLRLARAINHVDDRVQPPVHQIVFYQSGIGTEDIFDRIVNVHDTLNAANKVDEAYAFIAHNYRPGDEARLLPRAFPHSYTARMVAMFIGAIGVLDRKDMDHFGSIFIAYQKRGKAENPDELRELNEQLAYWTRPDAPGKRRAEEGSGRFSVKQVYYPSWTSCHPADRYRLIGVFETVGSVGMPEELTSGNEKMKNLFGFPDKRLGHHVERAYQALGLNEYRADFDCAKFEQTEEGRQKGQLLKQCWFIGSHADIGGGYEEHDLSDIALNWMIANVGDALSFDYDYVKSLLSPTAPWGTQPPHDSRTGIFSVSEKKQRKVPTGMDRITHEYIHSSVLPQVQLVLDLKEIVDHTPELVAPLLPWEARLKAHWKTKLEHIQAGRAEMEPTAVNSGTAEERNDESRWGESSFGHMMQALLQ
ncbi:hypothetical protein BD413DRAFT_465094 [Trametes elegans]|nr:hypothetical protein BD413DRAFT_465094 [Trametes elegans]